MEFLYVLIAVVALAIIGFFAFRPPQIKVEVEEKKQINSDDKSTGITQVDESQLPEISLQELRKYDGIQDKKIYLGVNGIVFDVTNNDFYQPGSGYHVFTGHDASYCLSTMSLNKEDLNKPYDNLDATQKFTMMEWYNKYQTKYQKVHRIKKELKTN